MNHISNELLSRSGNQCEICGSSTNLEEVIVSPKTGQSAEEIAVVCGVCKAGIEDPEAAPENHWRCLNHSVWSPVPAVQVISFRILKTLSNKQWAQDLLSIVYLDDQMLEWVNHNDAAKNIHKDSNGTVLQTGDSVTLIQDLDVKGANFTAKRGTLVKKIQLVSDHAGQIEGKVNDQQIVILTKYVKKSN